MNSARFATKEEIKNWNSLVKKNPGAQSFFQEQQFLHFKAQQKISPWRAVYVVHEVSSSQNVYVGYLVKRIIGLGEYWYAPFGPQVVDAEQVNEIIAQLRDIAPQAFTVLLEPSIPVSSEDDQKERTEHIHGAHYAPPIQPNVHTVIVKIEDEDEMFAALKQRTRRAIRQAQKANVHVKKVAYDQQAKDIFFTMYQETSSRAGFFIRDRQYYETFWDTYHKAGKGAFFFAYREDSLEPIAGAYILYDARKALYKDGASIRDGLPNGTLHLLHWEILRWLRQQGIQEYDLHGVPPSWQQDNKDHRQHGLGIFKSSFGETTDHIGALQWVMKPRQMALWNKGIKKLYFTLASRRGGFFF